MKRHCGRPIGGRGEGYAKSGQMRTRGEGGGEKWYFCADVLYGWPLIQCSKVIIYSLYLDSINSIHSRESASSRIGLKSNR